MATTKRRVISRKPWSDHERKQILDQLRKQEGVGPRAEARARERFHVEYEVPGDARARIRKAQLCADVPLFNPRQD